MKKSLTTLFFLFFLLSSCETDLKEGHYTCDPNEPGACPDGWVCQLRGTDGIHRCYDSAGAYCQNGVLDPGEICDGADLGDFTCERGFAICLTNCTAICTACGNGQIELNELGVGEQCDDGNSEDGDGCSAECLIERSYCVTPEADECLNWCGDGTINGPELCEPGNLGGYDCSDFGYHGGTLACTADCRAFDSSQCDGFCGDGIIQDLEVCDGISQNRLSCWDFYFTGGDLHCDTGCMRAFSGCFLSWNRHLVNTMGNITSVHGTDEANLFAVSLSGWIGHFNGHNWTNNQIPGDPMLRGVFTFAPDDAWAVGNFGTLLRLTNTGWAAFPTDVVTENLHLTSLWGAAPDDVWAVGFIPGYFIDSDYTPAVGVVLHFDGVDWTEVLRHAEVDEVLFISVNGSGTDDVWFVGNYGQVWHFDGNDDGRLDRITPPVLHATSEFSSVFVLNDRQRVFSGITYTGLGVESGFVLIEEDGVFSEIPVNYPNRVSQVRGTSADDLWIILDNGTVLRREPAGWRNLTPPLGSRFFSSWNEHPDTLWVGGANGLLQQYTGEFETVSQVFPQNLVRVWGAAPDDFYLAGLGGALRHLMNDEWVTETPGLVIMDLWGPSTDWVMAVGNLGKSAIRTGGTWSPVTTGVTAKLNAVHGCSATKIWAVGNAGTILHYDGAAWSQQNSGVTVALNDVFCVAPDAVYAVGHEGNILFYDGAAWSIQDSGTTNHLWAVWGSSRRLVLAVGNAGTIRRYDGYTWHEEYSGVGVNLRDIAGTNARNIWTVGISGVALRYAGVRFSPVTVPGNPALSRVHLQENGRILATAGASLLEYRSAFLPQVFAQPDCPHTVPLYCQEARSFDTTGMPETISTWGSTLTGLTGPETAFSFEAPFTGSVEWKLSPELTGARIIVLTAAAWANCDTSTVVALSATGGDGGQIVTIPVIRNQAYTVVIDSPTTAAGTLTSTCTR